MNSPLIHALPDVQEYVEGHVVFECNTSSLIQTVIQSLTEAHPQKDSLCAFLMAFYEGQSAYNSGYLLHQLGIIEQTHRMPNTDPLAPNIRVEIDYGNGVMDMYLTIFSMHKYPRVLFNDRFSQYCRSIHLIYPMMTSCPFL